MGLYRIAAVVESDNWGLGRGNEYDRVACMVQSNLLTPCDPTRTRLSGPADPSDPGSTTYSSPPNALVVALPRHVRCAVGYEEDLVRELTQGETEKAAEQILWAGSLGLTGSGQISQYAVSIQKDAVTVTAGSNTKASIAAALSKFNDITVGMAPFLHLGVVPGVEIADFLKSLRDELGVRTSVGYGYPDNAIAVTGAVSVQVGQVQVLSGTETSNNRMSTEATRLISVQFDPCAAVRVV